MYSIDIDPNVQRALDESRERIEKRKLLLNGVDYQKKLNDLVQLRQVMFSRPVDKDQVPFQPLNDYSLALLQQLIEGYIRIRSFHVLPQTRILKENYAILRHNLLSGKQRIKPDQFRHAANFIISIILEYVIDQLNISPLNTTVIFVWRAGLAFAGAAHKLGFRKFAHIGASRDEHTLETKIYHQELNTLGGKVAIVDPMLATGNSIISCISRLIEMGILEEDIVVVSMISAPEGVDHVLSLFPKIKILTGWHDEHLNERGFIVVGLGDFGDLWFEGVGIDQLLMWLVKEIITKEGLVALKHRMGLR